MCAFLLGELTVKGRNGGNVSEVGGNRRQLGGNESEVGSNHRQLGGNGNIPFSSNLG